MTIVTVCFTMNARVGPAAKESPALPLVVPRGDTLAGIAQRVYGHPEHERVPAAANGLGRSGGGAWSGRPPQATLSPES